MNFDNIVPPKLEWIMLLVGTAGISWKTAFATAYTRKFILVGQLASFVV